MRVVISGAALGLLWGIVARGWMRYISTTHEFSWSGTLAIIAFAGLAGTSLAVVEFLRRRGSGWWRRLIAIPALLLFVGAGIVLAPSALLGGFALSNRGPRSVRVIAGALAAVTIVLIWMNEEVAHSRIVGFAGLVVLCLALAAGWSSVFRAGPRPEPAVTVA